MHEEKLRIGGAVNLWTLAKSTKRSTVLEELNYLGMGHFCPEPRTPLGCLRAALDDVCTPSNRKERIVTRPIKDGFAVVAERPDEAEAGNDWGRVRLKATLGPHGMVNVSPFDGNVWRAIKDGIRGAAEWLTAESVSSSLIKIIESLGGISLRRSGGVYWLNEDRLSTWRQVASIFERASAHQDRDGNSVPGTAIHILSVTVDNQMVRAVGDNLTAEIELAIEQIEHELAKDNLKADACERRRARAQSLLDKVRNYEESFDITLASLHEQINKVSTAAAIAALQASAAAVAPSLQRNCVPV